MATDDRVAALISEYNGKKRAIEDERTKALEPLWREYYAEKEKLEILYHDKFNGVGESYNVQIDALRAVYTDKVQELRASEGESHG